jgi:amino acid permease
MGNFYVLVMFLRYPARWIVSVILVISMIELLIHSSLLDALRYNMILLYVVYLVIAVTMVITYIIIEPYLLYAFRGKSLISDERAAELIAENNEQ